MTNIVSSDIIKGTERLKNFIGGMTEMQKNNFGKDDMNVNVEVMFGTDVLFPNGTVRINEETSSDSNSNEVIIDFVAVDQEDIRFGGKGVESLSSRAIKLAEKFIKNNCFETPSWNHATPVEV